MKYLTKYAMSMTKHNRYKRTFAYLLVILGLVILAGAARADAATKGSVSFKVGSERVERVTNVVNNDGYMSVSIYIDGHESKNIEIEPSHDCRGYFYRSGVSVKLDTCKTGEHMKIAAASASGTHRVTVKWAELGSSDSNSKRRG